MFHLICVCAPVKGGVQRRSKSPDTQRRLEVGKPEIHSLVIENLD